MSSTQNLENENKKEEDLALFKLQKIEIDDEEKLIAYNQFNETARQLTSESIKINKLIKQVNFLLGCIHSRKLVLQANKKVVDEYALVCYGFEIHKLKTSS